MAQKIIGAQHDFSFGEIDVSLKRADDHPARKAGLRQMANMRILNSGAIQERSGRSALFPLAGTNCTRTEEVTMSSGNNFKLSFGPGKLLVFNSAGAQVASFTGLPWTALNLNTIVFAVLGLSIYITFDGMRPQVVTWDGVATWSIAAYTEQVIGTQKRTPFYRISPQGIQIQPGGTTGSVTVTASAAVFTPAHVGTRIRFVNRQLLITAYSSSTSVTATVEETIPPSQVLQMAIDPTPYYNIGDVVLGSVSGAKAIVTSINAGAKQVFVQLLSLAATVGVSGTQPGHFTAQNTAQVSIGFVNADYITGPGGALQSSSQAGGIPQSCAIWDEEVMNDLRGYPRSVFVDQFRLGFCDFPAVPGGIGWSAINSPTDIYVGVNPSEGIFEIAPDKVRVYYVVAGPESSEFVFCDSKLYYIKIDASNPLKPGSVSFQALSGDGCAQVQPRITQEIVLYVNAGGNSVMAIVASGAYYRPFNTKNLCDFHSHLFSNIVAIAAPTADGTFNERYAYVLNGNGSIVVGKYSTDDLAGNSNLPKIGWGPWSGVGAVQWVSARAANVLFTTIYFGSTICEILDDTQYLDGALSVNAMPAAFAPPVGHGPLWWIPSQSVSLMDQSTRSMGVYQIDASGFIIPQGNAGEDLTAASLVAGQMWTATVEPFSPNAQPGADAGQRMKLRQISYFAAYVIHSTGFVMGHLFSSRQTRTSPALGTLMNQRRFPAWNQDDDPTLPPPQREVVEEYPPQGSSYDPRPVLFKDTPGPLQILEFAIEVSI